MTGHNEESGGRDSLAQERYIRHKLYGGDRSAIRRYAELVIGDGSLWQLLKYELITTLFGRVPGALGLFLRKLFYPLLFERIGRGVVFGRDVVIRNSQRIFIGDRVVIDDDCLLDARGAGEEGLVIGAEVVINRGCAIQAKVGPIDVGAATDIGAHSSIISQGGVSVGAMVSMGSDCKIGGGLIQVASSDPAGQSEAADHHDLVARGQERVSKGPVRIADRCTFGMGVIVLDAVRIGEDSIVGAGVVAREDIAPRSIVMPHQRLIVMPRQQFAGNGAVAEMRSESQRPRPGYDVDHTLAEAESAEEPPPGAPGDRSERIAQAVLRAIAAHNEQLPPPQRIPNERSARLIEPDGPLDSLGVINLVVEVEDAVAADLGVSVNLVDLSGDADSHGPFATVSTLIDHVNSMLEQ